MANGNGFRDTPARIMLLLISAGLTLFLWWFQRTSEKIHQQDIRLSVVESHSICADEVNKAIEELRAWIEKNFPTSKSQAHLERDIEGLREELYRVRNGRMPQ